MEPLNHWARDLGTMQNFLGYGPDKPVELTFCEAIIHTYLQDRYFIYFVKIRTDVSLSVGQKQTLKSYVLHKRQIKTQTSDRNYFLLVIIVSRGLSLSPTGHEPSASMKSNDTDDVRISA